MVTLLLLLPKYTQSSSISQYLPQYNTSLKPDSSANPEQYLVHSWRWINICQQMFINTYYIQDQAL